MALALTAAASIAYGWAAIVEMRRPYWMDEVLAIWAARQPSLGAVWDALKHGAEFSPPLYHVLLWTIVNFGLDNPVALRALSVVAAYVVALSAFVLVRRRFAVSFACLALVTCLSGILFVFAVQARQYVFVAACFALVCTLWDGLPERRVSGNRALAIAVLLSIAIGMHFYAVLLVPTLGLMEAIWMVRHRRIRWPIVLALFFAGVSILLWLPIMQAVSAYNHGDTAAPAYYAKPTLARLIGTYHDLIVGGGGLLPVASAGLMTVLGARILAGRPAVAACPDLTIIASVLCVFPLLVFAFAAIVVGTFNTRYVIVASLGISLVVAQSAAAHRYGKLIACCLIAGTAATFATSGWTSCRERTQDALELLARAPGRLPIATGNGLRFFETYERSDRAVAERIVFLMVPSLSRSPDPTNDRQVRRWARIDPSLPIEPIENFLRNHAAFLVFADPATPDMLPEELRARGYTLRLVTAQAGMSLYDARPPVDSEGSRTIE